MKDAFNNRPQKGIIVGIYPENEFNDSTLIKTHPTYFSKSNEKGEYKIENLPAKTFYLYAFKDENSDIKYSKNEIVAFNKEPIKAIASSDPKGLLLYKPLEFEPNKLLDTLAKQKGKYQFVVYKPHKINIIPQTKLKVYTEFTPGKDLKDTISFYIPQQSDTIPLIFTIIKEDSVFQVSLKTKSKSKLPGFFLHVNTNIGLKDSIHIYSTTPLEGFIRNSIVFKEDTLIMPIKFFKEIDKQHWLLYHPFKEKTTYSIEIKDSMLQDVYGKFNKALKESIFTKSAKDYGNLILSIKTSRPGPFLIQLVEDNAEEKVIYTRPINTSGEILFEDINPIVVKVKIIIDINNNGKWDEGNLKLRILPEQVYYYDQSITIKAYWDIEHSIDLDKLLTN